MTEIIRNIDEDKVLEMANKIMATGGGLIEKMRCQKNVH